MSSFFSNFFGGQQESKTKSRVTRQPARVWTEEELNIWNRQFKTEFFKAVINRLNGHGYLTDKTFSAAGEKKFDKFYKAQRGIKMDGLEAEVKGKYLKHDLTPATDAEIKVKQLNEFVVMNSFGDLVNSIKYDNLERQVWDVCSRISTHMEVPADQLNKLVPVYVPRPGTCKKPYFSLKVDKETRTIKDLSVRGATLSATEVSKDQAGSFLPWFYGKMTEAEYEAGQPNVSGFNNEMKLNVPRLGSMLVTDKIDMGFPVMTNAFLVTNDEKVSELVNKANARSKDALAGDIADQASNTTKKTHQLGYLAGRTANLADNNDITLYTFGEHVPYDLKNLFEKPKSANNGDADYFTWWDSAMRPSKAQVDSILFQAMHTLKVMAQAGYVPNTTGNNQLFESLKFQSVKPGGHFHYQIEYGNRLDTASPQKRLFNFYIPNCGQRVVFDRTFHQITTGPSPGPYLKHVFSKHAGAAIEDQLTEIKNLVSTMRTKVGEWMSEVAIFDQDSQQYYKVEVTPLPLESTTTSGVVVHGLDKLDCFLKDLELLASLKIIGGHDSIGAKFKLDNARDNSSGMQLQNTGDRNEWKRLKDSCSGKFNLVHIHELLSLYNRLGAMEIFLTRLSDTPKLPNGGLEDAKSTDEYVQAIEEFMVTFFSCEKDIPTAGKDDGGNSSDYKQLLENAEQKTTVREWEQWVTRTKKGDYDDYTKVDEKLNPGPKLATFGWVDRKHPGRQTRALRIRYAKGNTTPDKKWGESFIGHAEFDAMFGKGMVAHQTFEEYRRENQPRYVLNEVTKKREINIPSRRFGSNLPDLQKETVQMVTDHSRVANPKGKLEDMKKMDASAFDVDAFFQEVLSAWQALPEGQQSNRKFIEIYNGKVKDLKKAELEKIKLEHQESKLLNRIKNYTQDPSLYRKYLERIQNFNML